MSSSISYLQCAHDFRIDNVIIGHTAGKSGKSAMECLEEHIAVGAIHNSDERCDAPTCFPETRVAVQEDIVSWITHGDEDDRPTRLMWISGPAGSGKTAIASSVAETCYERGTLAASFFFSSYAPPAERCSKRYLVPTLVHQLLQHEGLEVMEGHVGRAIQRDKAIFRKRLKDQFEALILNPLRRVKGQLGPSIPKAIIIDGVDGVKAERNEASSQHTVPRPHEDDHLEIITCLLHAVQDPAFPFRVIVISRPERVFTDFFSAQAGSASKHLFLNGEYDPNSDIRLYLTSKFAELRHRYGLSPSWPGKEIIEYIVWCASGQFVYAATVIHFVGNGPSPPPAQLDTLFPLRPLYKNRSGRGLSSLDPLYTGVLMSSPDPKLAVRWIRVFSFLCDISPWVLRYFLETEPGQGEHILRPLASLISIPDLAKNREEPYRVYHKSLLDFLADENRCPETFYEQNLTIARAWVILATRKAPITSLTESEKDEVLSVFTEFEVYIYIFPDVLEGFAEEDLIACNLYWWASQVLGRDGGLSVGLRHTLKAIHLNCRKSQGPCRGSCAKWSRDIFRAFIDRGWDTPSASFWHRYTNERDDTRHNDLWKDIYSEFTPPRG